jgi:hypothetical protein
MPARELGLGVLRHPPLRHRARGGGRARGPVRGGPQNPLQLAQDHVADEAGLAGLGGLPQQNLDSRTLCGVVFDHEADEQVRVNGDHGALSRASRASSQCGAGWLHPSPRRSLDARERDRAGAREGGPTDRGRQAARRHVPLRRDRTPGHLPRGLRDDRGSPREESPVLQLAPCWSPRESPFAKRYTPIRGRDLSPGDPPASYPRTASTAAMTVLWACFVPIRRRGAKDLRPAGIQPSER